MLQTAKGVEVPISVYRFWTDYTPSETGEARAIDWVEYGPVGLKSKNTTVSKVSTLSRVIRGANMNDAAKTAALRWDAIEPLYKRWKNGQELPEHGTPLAAWNGVTAEYADVLKVHGLKSVEDVAAMTDVHFERIPLPQLRNLTEQAKRFLASQDTVAVAVDLAKKDEQISAQAAQIADLITKVNQLAEIAANAPQKAKRGRPSKADLAAREAA